MKWIYSIINLCDVTCNQSNIKYFRKGYFTPGSSPEIRGMKISPQSNDTYYMYAVQKNFSYVFEVRK